MKSFDTSTVKLHVTCSQIVYIKILRENYIASYAHERAPYKEAIIMRKTLREVCNQLGVTRRAVQGYEKAGLVKPSDKNKYGHLLYDEDAINKISEIKLYQNFGFSIKEIQNLQNLSKEDYIEKLNEKLALMQTSFLNLKVNIEKLEQIISNQK